MGLFTSTQKSVTVTESFINAASKTIVYTTDKQQPTFNVLSKDFRVPLKSVLGISAIGKEHYKLNVECFKINSTVIYDLSPKFKDLLNLLDLNLKYDYIIGFTSTAGFVPVHNREICGLFKVGHCYTVNISDTKRPIKKYIKVWGHSRIGKSALINALFGLKRPSGLLSKYDTTEICIEPSSLKLNDTVDDVSIIDCPGSTLITDNDRKEQLLYDQISELVLYVSPLHINKTTVDDQKYRKDLVIVIGFDHNWQALQSPDKVINEISEFTNCPTNKIIAFRNNLVISSEVDGMVESYNTKNSIKVLNVDELRTVIEKYMS